MMKKDEEKKRKERQIEKKEERKQIYLEEKAQKDKGEAEKAEKSQKNPYSVFSKNVAEDEMEDDSVVFTEPSSSDHLPKGTLSRLPLT